MRTGHLRSFRDENHNAALSQIEAWNLKPLTSRFGMLFAIFLIDHELPRRLDNNEIPDVGGRETHEKGVFRVNVKHAIVRQVQGITFAGKSDTNHWVMIDGPENLGGSDGAPRPKELLLMALGSCTASDVTSILKKKRAPLQGLEVHLTAHVREEHPQMFTDIHIEYVVFGNEVNAADVERAIELSTTKYCAVSAMLASSVRITHSWRLAPSAQQAEPMTAA
jgi:putative redox protein